MVYDLHANNKELKSFRMGSDWLYLLAQCGSYFTCIHSGARWYMLFDERMTTHFHAMDDRQDRETVIDRQYPAILCNCGFEITEEEAKVMARIARNYAAIQRTIEEPSEEERNKPITTPDFLKPFPQWIRRDWVERYEMFAIWAEQSQGFKVF